MKMKKTILLLLTILFATPSIAEVVTQEVSYQSGDVALQGFLAYDNTLKRRPAVLVVHEWWGHNSYARIRAKMLAKLGYVAFALDMYGDGKVADHPDDAKKFMQEAMQDQSILKARFIAALNYVRQLDNVDQKSIAAIGYCFGGGVVLNMARQGVDLDGVVSFHGSLVSQHLASKDQVTAKVLVFHGGNDAFIPESQVISFEEEMTAANVDHEIVVYENVDHSFTNPDADDFAEKYNMPVSYDQDADHKSWAKMKVFLAELFGN